MPKSIFKFLFFVFMLVMISCAKRGSITGGDKDTIAPVLKASFPKNFSTNFNGKEIKLIFDGLDMCFSLRFVVGFTPDSDIRINNEYHFLYLDNNIYIYFELILLLEY